MLNELISNIVTSWSYMTMIAWPAISARTGHYYIFTWVLKRVKWFHSNFPLIKLQSPEYNLTSVYAEVGLTDLFCYFCSIFTEQKNFNMSPISG